MRSCFAAPENEPESTTRIKASIAAKRSIPIPPTGGGHPCVDLPRCASTAELCRQGFLVGITVSPPRWLLKRRKRHTVPRRRVRIVGRGRKPAPQTSQRNSASGDPVRPRAAHSIHERGRHVWDSKIDASTRRRMARAPTAVGWGRTIADSCRSFGRHRPLQHAKAEGRCRGERREHPQLGARRRVRSGGSLSARRRQRTSAEAGARSRHAVPGSAQGTCGSTHQDGEDARRPAGRAKKDRRLQVPDGDVEDPDGRAALRGRPRARRGEWLSWHGSGSRRPRPCQGRRQHPRRRGDALGDPSPGARREPGARALHLLRGCPRPAPPTALCRSNDGTSGTCNSAMGRKQMPYRAPAIVPGFAALAALAVAAFAQNTQAPSMPTDLTHMAQSAQTRMAQSRYLPEYTDSGDMKLPPDSIWREWVYVGSPLTPNALNGGHAG